MNLSGCGATSAPWTTTSLRVSCESGLSSGGGLSLTRATSRLLEHAAGRWRAIEHVEVDSGHASLKEFADLLRGKLHPGFKLAIGVVAGSFKGTGEAVWKFCLAEARDAFDLIEVGDRHDARHQWGGDAQSVAVIAEPGVLDSYTQPLSRVGATGRARRSSEGK